MEMTTLKVKKAVIDGETVLTITTKSGFAFMVTAGNDNGIHVSGAKARAKLDLYVHGLQVRKDSNTTEFECVTTTSFFGRDTN